jgi:hypothetical protein
MAVIEAVNYILGTTIQEPRSTTPSQPTTPPNHSSHHTSYTKQSKPPSIVYFHHNTLSIPQHPQSGFTVGIKQANLPTIPYPNHHHHRNLSKTTTSHPAKKKTCTTQPTPTKQHTSTLSSSNNRTSLHGTRNATLSPPLPPPLPHPHHQQRIQCLVQRYPHRVDLHHRYQIHVQRPRQRQGGHVNPMYLRCRFVNRSTL